MSNQPIDLAALASRFLDALVRAEQSKDPTALVNFVSPGVYDVRPTVDTPFQRIVVTCAYDTPVDMALVQDGTLVSGSDGNAKVKNKRNA